MFDELSETLNTIPISLIEVTAKEVLKDTTVTVGLLASPTTIKCGLFSNELQKRDVTVVTPTEANMHKVEDLIRCTIAGEESLEPLLKEQIKLLRAQGAQRVILGCTELSVIGDKLSNQIVIDPLKLVAEEIFNT